MLDTVRCNDHVGGLPNRDAFLAQFSKVVRARYCHFFPEKLEHGEFGKHASGDFVVLVAPESLKNLREYQVADRDFAMAQGTVKEVGLFAIVANEVINPDAGIHKDHEARLMSSGSPDHSSLPLKRLISSCFFSLIRVLSACSTTAFLVFRPEASSASFISFSSISILVRMASAC